MIYTFAFANLTVRNQTGLMSSIDTTIIISLLAVAVSFLTLYFTHLRGVSISLFHEYELPELLADEFKDEVSASLPVKVTVSVLNSGNRAGIVKDFNLKFKPQPDFEKFCRNNEIKWFSIKSAKTNQPASTILIKDRDTDLVIFSGFINLDWNIRMRYYLRTLDIESNNLKILLEEMLEYKKDLLKKFINFLKTNEKLGDLIISYSYTKPKLIFLPFIKFKKKDKSLELRYSYTETIKCYEDCLKNYRLCPHPTEIIKNVLRRIKDLKDLFDDCYNDEIKNHSKENLFSFPLNESWIINIINREDEEIELLSKCRDYRKIIEEDVKPLLERILKFNQKIHKATREPTEKLKQSSIEELKKDRVELKKELFRISPKLEELKKEVEHELEK